VQQILNTLKAAFFAASLGCVAIGCAEEEPPPPLQNEPAPNPENPDIPAEPKK